MIDEIKVFSVCVEKSQYIAVVMSSGSEFYNLAAMTGKARSPQEWSIIWTIDVQQ